MQFIKKTGGIPALARIFALKHNNITISVRGYNLQVLPNPLFLLPIPNQKTFAMKRFLTPFASAILVAGSIYAQESPVKDSPSLKFSGFVKTDAFFDTRQNETIREGHFLLYPKNTEPDANGDDINAGLNYNLLSIQSRIRMDLSGPEAFGAKTSGVIEADFFGNENKEFADVNGFRLRHAFVKLNWERVELLAGQFWHPMFVPEAFPAVISFNTGVPFQPFSRNPQIRVSYKAGAARFMFTAFSQRDFQSTGPAGSSTVYLRNSGIPNLNAQVQFNISKHQVNVGADYKVLKPELYTLSLLNSAEKHKSDQTVSGLSGFATVKLDFDKILLKASGVYAQNATDLVMLGGYGAKAVSDSATGAREFVPLATLSTWFEAQTKGKVQSGLFAGYTANLGASEAFALAYARGSNIASVMRVAPRVVFVAKKFNLALEGEYTSVAYGTADTNGKVSDTEDVSGFRGLLSFIYNF